VMPGTIRELARRQAGVDPSQPSILRQPELPLIAGVVALLSEHEFMHAVAELQCLKEVEFQSLDASRLDGSGEIEPEIP